MLSNQERQKQNLTLIGTQIETKVKEQNTETNPTSFFYLPFVLYRLRQTMVTIEYQFCRKRQGSTVKTMDF